MKERHPVFRREGSHLPYLRVRNLERVNHEEQDTTEESRGGEGQGREDAQTESKTASYVRYNREQLITLKERELVMSVNMRVRQQSLSSSRGHSKAR